MKVIICGAGQVGSNIARYLAAEDADVTVIDTSPELIERVQASAEVRGIVGFASHPDVLQEADANGADMLIAVTYADEVNMVACQVARTLFSVPKTIARVRSRSYLQPNWSDLFTPQHMPIDHLISPEVEVAHAVARRLAVPGALDIIALAEGRIQVVGVTCTSDCPIINTPLRQLAALFPNLNIVVCGIVRGGRFIIPSSNDQMLAADEVYFVAEASHVGRALAAFGYTESRDRSRRVVVLGGGNIGLTLAEELESAHKHVSAKIIEVDKQRAQYVAQSLTRTVVLNGDALDREILREANIGDTETVVAVTNDDKVNFLASLLCKQFGAKRAVTLINDPAFTPLSRPLGIDVMVSPRSITVSTILQHVRRGSIRSVHTIGEAFGEVIEADALDTSPLVGRPLRDISMPAQLIVAAVLRAGADKVLIPRGDTVIEAGDRVVLFAGADAVKQVEKMLRVKPEFF
ncbi:MAG: Trk system potassium transporter TrkA [Alphaproteobacteria bacterium]|nr:Trk system potassium transporter TrkA [Alphaproteobacteria bacterium]